MSDGKASGGNGIVDRDEATEWVVRRARPLHGNRLPPGLSVPPGFPIIVEDVSGVVCELVFFYLYEKHYQQRSFAFVPNKLAAYAFDCKDWLNFLDYFGILWHQATVDDLERYAGVMRATVSPTTGEGYRNATLRRRTSTVEGFYAWARESGLTPQHLPSRALLRPLCTGPTSDVETTRRKVSLAKTVDEDEPVRVMEFEQARSILRALGPLPSELTCAQITSPCRESTPPTQGATKYSQSSLHRLAAEFALNSGLRISETRSLDARDFIAYKKAKFDLLTNYKLYITGKGSKKRRVDVPGWLIQEAIAYIENERAQIATLIGDSADPDALLLSPIFAGGYAGRRVSVRTIERRFAAACIEVGQFYREGRTSIKQFRSAIEERLFDKKIPNFVFHDLRHTYAVWTYYARKRSGDSEPWLYIQACLGHRWLSTTIDTYLKAAATFEADVSDAYMRYLNERY